MCHIYVRELCLCISQLPNIYSFYLQIYFIQTIIKFQHRNTQSQTQTQTYRTVCVSKFFKDYRALKLDLDSMHVGNHRDIYTSPKVNADVKTRSSITSNSNSNNVSMFVYINQTFPENLVNSKFGGGISPKEMKKRYVCMY